MEKSEMNERRISFLPTPDVGGDYRTFQQGLLSREILEKTKFLLDHKGIGPDQKEFRLAMGVPPQLILLLQLRSRRDGYHGIVAGILTITRGCQAEFVITLTPASDKNGEKQPAMLSYQLTSKVKGEVVASYTLTFPDGELPCLDLQAKQGFDYKKIPKRALGSKQPGDRDFGIIKDILDFAVANDPHRLLYKKGYLECIRQIQGGRYVDGYSSEARKIEAEAMARLLEYWPDARMDDLD